MANLSANTNSIDRVSSPERQVGATRASLPILQKINVDEIEVGIGRRIIDPNWVEALAKDIAEHGQLVPIEVVKNKDSYKLIAGAHRLAAARHNFTQEIIAIVKLPDEFASEADIKLREIAENFMRRELSVLDRAMDVAAWREIFEQASGAIKPGRKAKKNNESVISPKLGTNSTDADIEVISRKFATNFKEAAQTALQLSKNGIFRALKISTIALDVREILALHAIANNQSELLALAAQPEGRQLVIADLIISEEARNVSSAIAKIDNLPAQQPAKLWEKFSNGFSKLKPNEQKQFFELNRAAIERWQAEG